MSVDARGTESHTSSKEDPVRNHMREGGEFDAVLNLLDRQVIDADGYMVCKVDDLELAQDDIGSLRISGILAGPAALLPRFSGRLGGSLLEQWRRIGHDRKSGVEGKGVSGRVDSGGRGIIKK